MPGCSAIRCLSEEFLRESMAYCHSLAMDLQCLFKKITYIRKPEFRILYRL